MTHGMYFVLRFAIFALSKKFLGNFQTGTPCLPGNTVSEESSLSLCLFASLAISLSLSSLLSLLSPPAICLPVINVDNVHYFICCVQCLLANGSVGEVLKRRIANGEQELEEERESKKLERKAEGAVEIR